MCVRRGLRLPVHLLSENLRWRVEGEVGKVICEKDKVVPVDGNNAPTFAKE